MIAPKCDANSSCSDGQRECTFNLTVVWPISLHTVFAQASHGLRTSFAGYRSSFAHAFFTISHNSLAPLPVSNHIQVFLMLVNEALPFITQQSVVTRLLTENVVCYLMRFLPEHIILFCSYPALIPGVIERNSHGISSSQYAKRVRRNNEEWLAMLCVSSGIVKSEVVWRASAECARRETF